MLIIIQTAIAIIVVYLVFSIIVYVIVEWIAAILRLRENRLKDAILNMFDNTPYKEFGKQILDHPQIESLRNKKDKLPSYIPANNVAVALIDLVKGHAANPEIGKKLNADGTEIPKHTQVYELYQAGLKQLDSNTASVNVAGKNSTAQKSFLTSITEQTNDLKSLTEAIERWFNNYMDSVTGWYKRNIKLVVLVVGAIVTVAFNVDTIHIVKVTSTDPVVRERLNRLGDELLKDSIVTSLVQQQSDGGYYDDYVPDESIDGKTRAEQNIIRDSLAAQIIANDKEELRHMTALINEWDLPVGWNIKKNQSFLLTILGWIITAFALSAGAPFWFDMLKRLVNIRNAGIKPDSSKKE